MPPYILPVEFRSPYPLDDCANRLQALVGQDYLRAEVDGLFVVVDKRQIDFRFHAHNHNIFRNGARRFTSDLIEAEIIGSLNTNDDGTTNLLIERPLVGTQYRLFLAKIALYALAFGMVVFLILEYAFVLSIIVALVVGLVVIIIMWLQRPYDVDKLIELLKSTLEATLLEPAE